MKLLIAFLPPLLIYGSWWLYGLRVKECKKQWKRMEAVANRNKKILTRGDVPEPPEVESLAIYAVGHEW